MLVAREKGVRGQRLDAKEASGLLYVGVSWIIDGSLMC